MHVLTAYFALSILLIVETSNFFWIWRELKNQQKTRELGEGWKHVYNIIIGDDPTFTDLDPKKCSEKYRKLANKTTISSTISSVAHLIQRETELMQEELSRQLKLRKYNSAQSQYNRESRETGGGP